METLHQEYVFICEHLRRLEEGQERIEKQTLLLIKEQIANLQKRVEVLEARI